jgi:hypothetical protein
LWITFTKWRVAPVIVIALRRAAVAISVSISDRLIDKGAENPKIMFCMLKVTFRQHTITGRRRIAR